MDNKGWIYRFESLPHWDDRDGDAYAYDELTENAVSDTACLLYSIREVHMGTWLGRLAVFENKTHPQLLVNVTSFCFWRERAIYSADGALLFLKAYMYEARRNRLRCPLVVMDIPHRRFALVDMGIEHAYTVREEDGVFSICVDAYQATYNKRLRELDGRIIDVSALQWKPLDRLNRQVKRPVKQRWRL